MREQKTENPEELLLTALHGFYKGVNKKPLDYLIEKNVPYYSQLTTILNKNNLVKYNKDSANPYTKWLPSSPPDIKTAKKLFETVTSERKRKAGSKKQQLIESIKILCERLEETSPGFKV